MSSPARAVEDEAGTTTSDVRSRIDALVDKSLKNPTLQSSPLATEHVKEGLNPSESVEFPGYESIYMQLRPENSTSDRISAAEYLRFSLKICPLSDVATAFEQAKDLVDPGNPRELRLAGFDLFASCIRQSPVTDQYYFACFGVPTPADSEDFHLQISSLQILAKHTSYDYEMLHLLSLWLLQSFIVTDVARKKPRRQKTVSEVHTLEYDLQNLSSLFKFITSVIELAPNRSSENATADLIDVILYICNHSTVSSDLHACILLIKTVVTYAEIPSNKLEACVGVLSRMHYLVDEVNYKLHARWSMKTLCKSRQGRRTVEILLAALNDSPEDKADRRGAIREICGVLSMLQFLIVEDNDGHPGVPVTPLVAALTKLMAIEDRKMENEIIRLTICLFQDRVIGNTMKEDWPAIFRVLVECLQRSPVASDGHLATKKVRGSIPVAAKKMEEEQILTATLVEGLFFRITEILTEFSDKDFAQREDCFKFFLAVHTRLPEPCAKLVIDHYKESYYCGKSDLDWKKRLNLLHKAVLGRQKHPETTNSFGYQGKSKQRLQTQDTLADKKNEFRQVMGIYETYGRTIADIIMEAKSDDAILDALLEEGLAIETVPLASIDNNSNLLNLKTKPQNMSVESSSGSSAEEPRTTDLLAISRIVTQVESDDSEQPHDDLEVLQEIKPFDGSEVKLSYSSSRSTFRKSSEHVFHSIRSLFLSSELPPHIHRIRWTCNCGYQSYDDFISERRVVKAIADRLSGAGLKAEIVNRRDSGIAALWLLLRDMAFRKRPEAHREPRQSSPGNLQSSGRPSAATHNLNQSSLEDSHDITEVELFPLNTTQTQKLKKETEDLVRFLHLCVHMNFKLPCMQHFMIGAKGAAGDINCDQQLFKEIKKRHVEARKRRFPFLVKLKGIYFVQYRLFPRTIVGGLKENKTPTDTSEYDFEEIRELKDGDSPIPPNVMLHFYDEPDHIMDGTMCLDAFPKRKVEPLYWQRDQPNVGYGIYLKEEPDEVLFALIRCTIAFTVGLVGWIVFLVRRDLESGYPWAAILWISGIGVGAVEVLKEWLKTRFESGAPAKAKIE